MKKTDLYEYKAKKISIYALAKKYNTSRPVVINRLLKLAIKEIK